ncbi:hypothetical protein E2C01_096738 [Portunus trituberculatus]|uniref:Uncharacterized protein n=1 Tax=Portunus trituberculatus TaxID=210409 RepID=A0A5B7K2J6_PORTR|nr:hypothetical protein [Portunus trituberculatus]
MDSVNSQRRAPRGPLVMSVSLIMLSPQASDGVSARILCVTSQGSCGGESFRIGKREEDEVNYEKVE